MHAFDFILVLFSFVYAAAVTHVLSTAGEIIIDSENATKCILAWIDRRVKYIARVDVT